MNDLNDLTRHILEKGGYTCVIAKDGHFYTSQFRGVKPLVQFLHSQTDFSGSVAADRVVGRATAFLYVLLGVRAVYANVLSRGAMEVLQAQNVEIAYDNLVEHIINRRKDGICPFEEAVMEIHCPEEALQAIERKMIALGI